MFACVNMYPYYLYIHAGLRYSTENEGAPTFSFFGGIPVSIMESQKWTYRTLFICIYSVVILHDNIILV